MFENEERLTQEEYQRMYWLLDKFSGKSDTNKTSYDDIESKANELIRYIEFRAYPVTKGERIGVKEGWFCAIGNFVRFDEEEGKRVIVLEGVEVRTIGEAKKVKGEEKFDLRDFTYYRTHDNEYLIKKKPL